MMYRVVRYLTLVPDFGSADWFPKWYPAHVAAGGE
jgi:hypothetical protein